MPRSPTAFLHGVVGFISKMDGFLGGAVECPKLIAWSPSIDYILLNEASVRLRRPHQLWLPLVMKFAPHIQMISP